MAAAAASKHMVGQQGRVQGSDAPPIGSLGRVAGVSGDKVSWLRNRGQPLCQAGVRHCDVHYVHMLLSGAPEH